MKLTLPSSWPILIFAILFIVLPLSTIPGMFDFIFVILGLITVAILALLIWSAISSRRSA